MKKTICILIFLIVNYYGLAQDAVFRHLTKNVMGGDYEITLTLKENNEFLYSEIDDQECYVNTGVSLGKWEQKGKNIILKVADTIQPKIKIEKPFLKKDTLTIFFKKMNDCDLLNKVLHTPCYDDKDEDYFNYYGERDLHFYDKDGKEISIGLQNKAKIEIPTHKKIAKIDFYFPNDWSPNSAKLSLKVSDNTGQIYISNLSGYLQSNFDSSTFVLNKNHILLNGFRIKKVKLKRQKKK